MPVMKNEFDIYKTGRSRRTSECSNASTCRSRKISECSRSECPSLSTSPGSEFMGASPAHRSQPLPMHRMHSASRPTFSRTSSRNSQSSLITSPTKSTGNSPPKVAQSETSLSKFHTRLVDKLRKSLRRGKSSESDRSWGDISPPHATINSSNLPHSRLSDTELGCSDSVLHLKSKPPLPRATTTAVSTPKLIKPSASRKFRRIFGGSSSAPR